MDVHRRRSLGLVTAAVVATAALAASLVTSMPVAASTSPSPLAFPRVGPGPGSAGVSEGTASPSSGTGQSRRVDGPLGASDPWSVVGSGDTTYSQGPSNEDGDELNDVTCVSSTDCWAVGYYYNGTVDQTLIEQDTGSGWFVVPSPDTSGSLDNVLNGVACAGQSGCWAVGSSYNGSNDQTLIEQETGSGWSIVVRTNSGFLTSISCVNIPLNGMSSPYWGCFAVGTYYNGSVDVPLEEWYEPYPYGLGWHTGAAFPSGSASGELTDIDCFSNGDCWAVGFTTGGTVAQTLIGEGDGVNMGSFASGSWSVVPSPDTSSSQANALSSVSCVSSSDCWAVGGADTGSGGDAQNLVEQYNGSSWSIVPSPDTSSSQPNLLEGVACPSATDCQAVGFDESGSIDQTLAAQYNGSSWSIVPSPDMSSGRDNELFAVACVSSADCRGVGTFVNGTAFSALVEQTAVTEEAALASASLGTVAGTLHPISWGTGNEDVFWRGTDGNLWQEYAINGTWYGPQQMTTLANLASDPQPISWGYGNEEVFWRGTDGNLWQMYYLNGWQGPSSLGDGPLGNATPEPVSWGPGNIEVFWEGTDQNLWEAYYANGWHGPQGLGDGPLGVGNTPQPVSWGVGNLEIFWEGTDQNLWEAYYANGWVGPQGLGDGPLGPSATLTPVSWGVGNLDVFWKGTDQNLWEAYYANGWHGPQGLGDGPLGSAPHPVASASGVLDVFWSGTDGGLWHTWYAGGWIGPASFGGVPTGDAALVAPPQPLTGVFTNPAEVFWEGPFGTIWFASSNN